MPPEPPAPPAPDVIARPPAPPRHTSLRDARAALDRNRRGSNGGDVRDALHRHGLGAATSAPLGSEALSD